LAKLIESVRRAGKVITVYGEMASDPAGALWLLGMGIGRLGMNCACLPRIKW